MRKFIKILGNGKIGFVLAMAAALSLVQGSIVMNMNPKLYPPFFPFDLNFFFNPIRPVHFWLYSLLGIFFLFGGSIFFSSLDLLLDLLQNSSRTINKKTIAALFIHVAIILALLAHLYEGFGGKSSRVMIGERETNISGIGKASIKSIKQLTYPDGSLKDTLIDAKFIFPNGEKKEVTLSYNRPAIFAYGTKEVILEQAITYLQTVFVLDNSSGKEVELIRGKPVSVKSGKLMFQDSYKTGDGIFIARIQWLSDKQEGRGLFLTIGGKNKSHNSFHAGGVTYRYLKKTEKSKLRALIKYNPSMPIIYLALLSMITGLYYLIKL